MPLENVRYRVVTAKSGKKIRLAFRKGTNKVVEHKELPKLSHSKGAMMHAAIQQQ